MLTNRYIWVTCLFWAACYFLEALAVETVKPSQLPQGILKSLKNVNATNIKEILNRTRRILLGEEAKNDLPYMVYLKLPSNNVKFQDYKRWLCGGVIVHEEYILTSAACIEDVKNFYVVPGTAKFAFSDDRHNNMCIKNGAKKAVWKCIPRNYVFDGHENDNIRWMNNDIAVVKLEDELDFTRRVRGCDFTPRPVCYNNSTSAMEDPENHGIIAGWGSTEKYNDWINARRSKGTRRQSGIEKQMLLKTIVTILKKSACKRMWGHRYDNIIDNYMICTEDMTEELSEICQGKYVDCTDIVSESDENARRDWNPENMRVHSAYHNDTNTRRHDGGFCENDHGGPLIYGEGVTSVVIGIISACLVKERSNKCYGPFLFTSVYKNRVLINCAIYKNQGQDCNKLFRASITHTEVEMSWFEHPDGPAQSELKAKRRQEEEKKLAKAKNFTENPATSTTTATERFKDVPLQHAGFILRSSIDDTDVKAVLIDKINITAINKTI